MNIVKKLRLENKSRIALRKATRKELEDYRKKQKKLGKPPSIDFIQSLRSFGKEEARYFHVAYSLLRGRKYTEIERVTKTPIEAGKLLNVLQRLEYFWTLEKVKDLLKE